MSTMEFKRREIMKRKRIALAIGVLILLVSYFPLKHHLEKRSVLQMTKTILKYWQTNNLPATYVYWKDPYQAPPIYGLEKYKILKTNFPKSKGVQTAEVYIYLDFPSDNLLPSGKVWILQFYKFPRLGWLVSDFRIDPSSE